MPNLVGLNQYIHNNSVALYSIKIWLEMAEIVIESRKTNQLKLKPNQTIQRKQNQTKTNQILQTLVKIKQFS